MKRYLVGGAVRDLLRGVSSVKDYDYVVVGSTPEEMEARGFKPVGGNFRVYLDGNGHEHALARRERKDGVGHRGFVIETGPEVTLEDDLRRRDLTINAIAMDPDTGEVFDPLGGREDLRAGILRAANPSAFADDPVRVLRLARFAATLFGFKVDPLTMGLASRAIMAGELQHEPGERIYQEATRALTESSMPSVFFRLLQEVGALREVLPEVAALVGVEQPLHGHPEGDAFNHTMLVIDQAARSHASYRPSCVMWAALLHDVGKGLTPRELWPAHHGHERAGLPAIEDCLLRLGASSQVLDFARTACRHHMRAHRWRELRAGTVLEMLIDMGALRDDGSQLMDYIRVFNADTRGRLIGADEKNLWLRARFFDQARAVALQVTGQQVLSDARENAKRRGVEPQPPGGWVGDAILARRIRAIKALRREILELS